MSRQSQYKTFSDLDPSEKKQPLTSPCLEIRDLEHKIDLLKNNEIVCIDLYGKWCEPCKVVGPKFDQLAQKYNIPGKCLLVKENVELGLINPREYSGERIPAFIFYRNGTLLRHKDGTVADVVGGNIEDVQNILERLLMYK
jgi:thioredoxin 1